MPAGPAGAELVIALNPVHRPSPRLTAAAVRAGALGVLDLGAGDRRGVEAALARTVRWSTGPFGVRIGPGCAVADLPDQVRAVLLADPARSAAEFDGRRVLVEVTDRAEAVRAVAAGAHGLIARGSECGGRVGDLSTFILLQQLLADPDVAVPVWAAGGIGPHTAAAAVAGGAAGVVLDTQLALLAEADLPVEVAETLAGLDGSESVVHHGHRVLLRRGPGVPALPADRAEFLAMIGGTDLRAQFVPVGQDGFLARWFADRWGTVSAAVQGIRAAVVAAIRTDDATAALGADSLAARALGTALPLAQGPMTRVSDQAEFAAAVAAEGALPFIALALSGREQTRTVLERTRDSLGAASWGVGVLGFAAEEIKAAQLELIAEIRPTHAIIAGGRPAQAAALEAAGIVTFLHVPSPGLLRQFLAAGARRFIFEGSECGGHVGPRNSFPLWEAQIAVLAEFLAGAADATGLTVLFAGGVHDERSSAMVAAMAAPLTARGVAVGSLMGTAYLFTEEAVRAGAITPLFQRQVVAAERTDLLETAPGHATRCVHSGFTAEFAQLKGDFRADGVPDREVWERLEKLNVGRLRLASKGIERVGDDLLAVGEDRQLTEGMFMAGEVAVLRDAITTIGALHESVTAGAARLLTARAAELRAELGVRVAEAPAPEPLRIAVVGMSAMFPGAPDLGTFWANILSGKDSVTEVPADRWDPEIYYAPDGSGERTASRWGGFLPQIPFDPLRYGIPPASLASIEPVQLLALEAARRALADAGYAGPDADRSRTSVVFGAEAGSDLSNATTLRTVLPAYLGAVPAALDEQLPKLTEDSFPGMLANVIAGRVANRLDLGGANYTVDAACASSLAAVDVACKELVTGTSDLVLCGGADLHNGINDYLLFSSVHALSPTGRSATFDTAADGIALGEGVACVALKRLADAERDGDRIYAVIDGVGSASDGRSLGLTAPRPEGQRAALTRAYRNAGVSPAQVGLVEAHGTGTVVGDRTELQTLTDVFIEAGAAPESCTVGSVKSQIGHTKCAAGLAGLIKTVLALHTGVKPPTLHIERPNSAWDRATSPFVFHTAARPWAAEPAGRVAGVSAFGFGGTNFHVVLRAYDQAPPEHTLDEWPVELFTFRGADLAAASRAAQHLLDLVEAGGGWRLRDFAHSAARRSDGAAGRGEAVRIAVVAADLAELPGLLRRAIDGAHDPAAGIFAPGTEPDGGEVAFLFPGQGSQRPGMLAELLVTFPELQHYLQLGARWADVLYPPAAFDERSRADQLARITDTTVAQPALGIVGLAAADLLGKAGVRPDMVAGHSYGELVALAAVGALDADTLLTASSARAEAILAEVRDGDAGAMAAINTGADQVDEVLRLSELDGCVVTANRNSPKQTVISGPTDAVAAAVRQLRDAGFGAKSIPVACAFHSPLVAGASAAFADVLGGLAVRAPEVPVWSNRTAGTYPTGPDEVRTELAAQVGAPVRFADQIEAMYAAGARTFVEVGPGTVLTRLVSDVLGDRPYQTVALEGDRRTGLPGFLAALARLAVAGVELRTGWLFRGRDAADPATAAAAKPIGWTVDGHLVRLADGTIPATALRPARRIQELTVSNGNPVDAAGGADALVAEFLRTSREMIAAQRDVLLSYLGATATAPTAHVYNGHIGAAPRYVQTALPAAVEPAPVPSKSIVDPAGVLAAVLGIIAERTGYPVDMIEPELDLEADLSVDSIKRAEIAGELAVRLGLPSVDDADVEELSKARTAAGIADLIVGRLAPTSSVESVAAVETGAVDTGSPPSIIAPQRLEFAEFDLPASADGTALTGVTMLLLGGGGTAETVAERLRSAGAVPVLVPSGQVPAEVGPSSGVVFLDALDATESVLPGAFPVFQAVLAHSPKWLIAADRRGTGQPSGLRGFFRTVAREYPDTVAALVEVGANADAATVADAVLAELTAGDTEPVVLADGGRRGLRLEITDLGLLGSTGAGPAGDGVAEAAAIGLDRDSVVLLAGGARGITARFALAIAASSRCRIELLGRTPVPPAVEDPATASAAGRAELRAAFIAQGLTSPAAIERAATAVLAEREVRETLARVRDLGSAVRYHSVDMLDEEAVRTTVKEIHTEHGRLDGIVYAAGVIEDKLIAEKSADSFGRVYRTKVDGARTLLDTVDALPDGPRFAVLFGSIAAALGNRGQVDYAAANDALEELAQDWSTVDRRGLTVHWGPWAPTGTNDGMVTPELMRSYAARGIALIDPEEGVLSLLRELAWGPRSVHAVVYTASGW
ncbi:SDR family NAD(P)-dependent oxidoreductase [Actinokineospora sp.]|uniref:SDR family NAD(P)-dependent oxidoreductase n=1 Tax=Actinokineospora sp. TaxID=1872133 RepID=UPI004037E765